MDGGFSDNLLVLDDNTITVSPFAGESDICPQDNTFTIVQVNLVNTSISVSPGNIYRLTRILFPPHPEVMSKMCQQGFDDALRFLQRNSKISCLRCVAIQTSFTVSETEDVVVEDVETQENANDSGYEHAFDDCNDCRSRREKAVIDSLPDPVARAIQDACDQVNKGVINWIFKHRPVKLLSLLTVPYILPFDITIVCLIKLWRQVPWIKRELKQSLYNLISFTKSQIVKMESKRHLYSAKFSCQLAVTEFNYSSEEKSKVPPSPRILHQSIPQGRKISLAQPPMPVLSKVSLQRAARVEKSNSFGGRRIVSEDDLSPNKLNDAVGAPRQRKSYAGSEFMLNKPNTAINRRKSMMAAFGCKPPERVISKKNLVCTFDLSNAGSTTSMASNSTLSRSLRNLAHVEAPQSVESDYADGSMQESPPDVIATYKTLSEDYSGKELSALNLANRALNLERDVLGRHATEEALDTMSEDGFAQLLEAASHHERLMAFRYTDENNRVKITEIYNIPDPEPGLSQEQLSEKW